MRAQLNAVWEELRASYWFIPTILMLLAACLAFGLVALDSLIRGKVLQDQGWIFSGGAAGARGVLSTVAGSIITVAATTFSITIAVLSTASGQFGPRLLRSFMRDRGSQSVLGSFVATFLYCLLVLRTVRGTDSNTYVPHLSVTVGVMLAVVCLGTLIYFIHHTAESIQISRIVEIVAHELNDTLKREFPETEPSRLRTDRPEAPSRLVVALKAGYVLDIDYQELLERGTRDGLIYLLHVRPGDFLVPGMTLVQVWGQEEVRDEEAILRVFTLGRERSPEADSEYAFLQLVEVAIRALSPGINDPFTAIVCIDRISAGLCFLATRFPPPTELADENGIVRVMLHCQRFEELVHSAFAQIRHYGKDDSAVVRHLREQIDLILARVQDAEFQLALQEERNLLPEAPGSLIAS